MFQACRLIFNTVSVIINKCITPLFLKYELLVLHKLYKTINLEFQISIIMNFSYYNSCTNVMLNYTSYNFHILLMLFPNNLRTAF